MGQITVDKNVGGIEGLCVIKPAVHGDDRGYFMETYNEKDMKEAGIDIKFVQDNKNFAIITNVKSSGSIYGFQCRSFSKMYCETMEQSRACFKNWTKCTFGL